MDFALTPKQEAFRNRVRAFVDESIRPRLREYAAEAEAEPRWKVLPIVEALKSEARSAGLWNLFMPPFEPQEKDGYRFNGPQLTNLEYALCAEEMGRIS